MVTEYNSRSVIYMHIVENHFHGIGHNIHHPSINIKTTALIKASTVFSGSVLIYSHCVHCRFKFHCHILFLWGTIILCHSTSYSNKSKSILNVRL